MSMEEKVKEKLRNTGPGMLTDFLLRHLEAELRTIFAFYMASKKV